MGSEAAAVDVVSTLLGSEPIRTERLLTGLHNWVYGMELASGVDVVVRIGDPASEPHYRGGLHWHSVLTPLGVPLPKLIGGESSSDRFGFPYMVMERLKGTDLGHVYGDLTDEQLVSLATDVAVLQKTASQLPEGSGYGYGFTSDDLGLLLSWADVLEANLHRSGDRDHSLRPLCADVRSIVQQHAALLVTVAPKAFFHDLTTKNLIVHEGELSGIVDVDSMGFGDDLYTTALTRVALDKDGHHLRYIDAWLEARAVTDDDRARFAIYTAVFALDLLSEQGGTFNRRQPTTIPQAVAERLFHLAGVRP